jgi:hypothetical protein
MAGCVPANSDTCPLNSDCYPLGLITCIPTHTNKPTSILLTMGALKNSLLYKHSTNLKNGEVRGKNLEMNSIQTVGSMNIFIVRFTFVSPWLYGLPNIYWIIIMRPNKSTIVVPVNWLHQFYYIYKRCGGLQSAPTWQLWSPPGFLYFSNESVVICIIY